MLSPEFIEPETLGRSLFISPHFNDAVFSCGRLLASLPDSVVGTLFGGFPPDDLPATKRDAASGFASSTEAIATRRTEDCQALASLAAWPLWQGLPEAQYGRRAAMRDAVERLHGLVKQCEPDAVFFPLGLHHEDHHLTREATLVLLQACPSCRWFVYEEALYRCLPGAREEGMAAFGRNGLALRPARFVETPTASLRKRAAVACYRSRLQALCAEGGQGDADLEAPEAYWQVTGAG